MNVSTLAMYMQLLDRVEELLPCRQEYRLKAALNEAKIHFLTLEPDDLRAVVQLVLGFETPATSPSSTAAGTCSSGPSAPGSYAAT